MLLKRIKYIIILFVFLCNTVMAASLKSIKNLGNSIDFEFVGSDVPKNKVTYYPSSNPIMELKFYNTTIDKKNIRPLIKVNNIFLKQIYVDSYKKTTTVLLYMNNSINYEVFNVRNTVSVNFKAKNIVKRPYTIVIDPGHGGKDGGAGAYGYNEKDLALAVALKLYNILKDEYEKVIITRSTDVFIPLDKRAEIGNDANADVFISIHLNKAANKKARGTEAFYFSKNPSKYAQEIANFENNVDKKGAAAIENSAFIIQDVLYKLNQKQSANLAENAIENISESVDIPKRKVLGANFAVLRGSHSPAILIELGFMSNKNDLSKYISQYYQQKAAEAIAKAVNNSF